MADFTIGIITTVFNGSIQKMSSYAEELRALEETIRSSSFGSQGELESAGPCAQKMCQSVTYLGLSVRAMHEIIDASVAHLNEIATDIQGADEAGQAGVS